MTITDAQSLCAFAKPARLIDDHCSRRSSIPSSKKQSGKRFPLPLHLPASRVANAGRFTRNLTSLSHLAGNSGPVLQERSFLNAARQGAARIVTLLFGQPPEEVMPSEGGMALIVRKLGGLGFPARRHFFDSHVRPSILSRRNTRGTPLGDRSLRSTSRPLLARRRRCGAFVDPWQSRRAYACGRSRFFSALSSRMSRTAASVFSGAVVGRAGARRDRYRFRKSRLARDGAARGPRFRAEI